MELTINNIKYNLNVEEAEAKGLLKRIEPPELYLHIGCVAQSGPRDNFFVVAFDHDSNSKGRIVARSENCKWKNLGMGGPWVDKDDKFTWLKLPKEGIKEFLRTFYQWDKTILDEL